jgi:hypothetical protein
VQELRKRLAGLVLYLRCGIDFQPKALARGSFGDLSVQVRKVLGARQSGPRLTCRVGACAPAAVAAHLLLEAFPDPDHPIRLFLILLLLLVCDPSTLDPMV